MKLAILMLDGAMHSAVAGVSDLLALSNTILARQGRKPAFQWSKLTPTGSAIQASGGQCLEADGNLAGAPRYDAVLIPGMLQRFPETANEGARCIATSWLRKLHARGTRIGASCGGVFLLAEAGMLDGRRATTTWWLQSELVQRHPKINLARDAVVTENERIFCAAGPMSWVDLLLKLIAATDGPELSRLCADYAVIDTAERTQAAFVPMAHMLQQDPLLVEADMLVRCRGNRSITVQGLAHSLRISERTLHRRFVELTGESAKTFIQRRRIDVARTLLETTERSIKDIAHAVGYDDESSFRKAFRNLAGHSPRAHRSRVASSRSAMLV